MDCNVIVNYEGLCNTVDELLKDKDYIIMNIEEINKKVSEVNLKVSSDKNFFEYDVKGVCGKISLSEVKYALEEKHEIRAASFEDYIDTIYNLIESDIPSKIF